MRKTPWYRPSPAAAGGLALAVAAGALSYAFWFNEPTAAAPRHSDFDLSRASIPKDQILSGGPGKDGIPAILKPKFVRASDADFLRDGDLVVGYAKDGEARAYPLRILVWHEIVNDTLAGQPLAITYCPLCGTCMVFDRRVDGSEHTFGVSGLLYQSDVLMYDHQTESLWSQLGMRAVTGRRVGAQLTWLPSEQMTWQAWRERHPETRVLSTDTGHRRDYGRMPYGGYEHTDRIMFPVPSTRTELRAKAWVIGILVNGAPKAYPIRELERLGDAPLRDTVGGAGVEVRYFPTKKHAQVTDAQTGEALPHVAVFWFAWQAFYPGTELFKAS